MASWERDARCGISTAAGKLTRSARYPGHGIRRLPGARAQVRGGAARRLPI